MSSITPENVLIAYKRTVDAIREEGESDLLITRLQNQKQWFRSFFGFDTTKVSDQAVKDMDNQALAEEYLALRVTRSELKARYEADDEKYKSRMANIESVLGGRLEDSGASSITINGLARIFFRKTTRYVANDWTSVYNWIMENKDFSILNKALNASGINAVIGPDKDTSKLPGIDANTVRDVCVNRCK